MVMAKAKLRALLGGANADPSFDVDGTSGRPMTAEPLAVEEAFSMAQRTVPTFSRFAKVSKAQGGRRCRAA